MMAGSKKTSIRQILRGTSPEMRLLLLAAYEQGLGVSLTGNGHFRVTTPPGAKEKALAFMPGTPSEYRAIANARRKLRRMGVRLP